MIVTKIPTEFRDNITPKMAGVRLMPPFTYRSPPRKLPHLKTGLIAVGEEDDALGLEAIPARAARFLIEVRQRFGKGVVDHIPHVRLVDSCKGRIGQDGGTTTCGCA